MCSPVCLNNTINLLAQTINFSWGMATTNNINSSISYKSSYFVDFFAQNIFMNNAYL